MDINIQQHHIDEAIKAYGRYVESTDKCCPVAKALKEVGYEKVRVFHDYILFKEPGKKSKKKIRIAETPISWWIRYFDNAYHPYDSLKIPAKERDEIRYAIGPETFTLDLRCEDL